jgi:3-ketosteroid 9alpha-monooxygenase subunit A
VLAEHGAEGWVPYERRRWRIRTRNQEIAENGVDRAHFATVHGVPEMPATEVAFTEHIMHVTARTRMHTRHGPVPASIETVSHGLGFTVTRFTGIVETLLISTVTPLDDEHVELRFAFTCRGGAGPLGKAFFAEVSRQLEQDIVIWEHKRYVDPPLLCDGDGPIGRFRRWARQFYPA